MLSLNNGLRLPSNPFDFELKYRNSKRCHSITCKYLVEPSDQKTPPVKVNPFQKMCLSALELIEKAIVIPMEKKRKLPSISDPKLQIAGNFFPVPESQVRHNLEVIGKIPDQLHGGVYVRNGSNPLLAPLSGYHVFDGDGMIHLVKFSSENSASYCCRFTRTNRLVSEESLGRPIFPRTIGELHGFTGIARLFLFHARGAFGLVKPGAGVGAANAGLVYFNGRLLAMSEDDHPYHIIITNSGDLKTVGKFDFDGQLPSSMIAHPKIDPVTGELFTLSYDVIMKPHLRYFRFNPTGKMLGDVHITLKQPVMAHDFTITENFVIIPDQQVLITLPEMFYGRSPVIYEKMKMTRFGVMHKSDEYQTTIRWINVPDCFCFHFYNAWEEFTETKKEIVVIASCMSPPDSVFEDKDEPLSSLLTEIRLNLITGESTRRVLVPNLNLEVGQVNKTRLGRKTRFSIFCIAEPWPKISGLAKVDLETGDVKVFHFGDKRFGAEPMFVPVSGVSSGDDSGYVLVFVHDEDTDKSELLILNGATMAIEASVKLDSRVPNGFHGTFINSEELKKQKI